MVDKHIHRPSVPATIKDVARRSGVSVATASRALGNYGSVKEETRRSVLEAAAELNYVPNAVARSMVKLKTGTIGLVVPDIRNAFFGAVAQSVTQAAKQSERRVIVCDTGGDFESECDYLQDLVEQRVDGILLASSVPWDQEHRLANSITCPVVLVDRVAPGINADCVRSDHVQGARELVRHLIDLGHRRIGIVLGTGRESVHRERFQGYAQALEEAGIPSCSELVKVRDWEHGLGVVKEFLDLDQPPTAIFTTNNVVTVLVLADLKRLGRRIPDDVAVAAFDDLELGNLLETPLTAVVQNPTLIGRRAMEIMLHRLAGEGPTELETVILQPTLVVRKSCGAL